MTNKVRNNERGSASTADDLEALYYEMLRRFYEQGNRKEALKVAEQLEAALNEGPDLADSIRGDEIRSLIAELHGDVAEAIRSREAEIRKIFQLHSLAQDSSHRQYVFAQYDYSDISDRLDLLACLYADQGNLSAAITTLRESKRFCQSHKIPFDGQDLLEEFEQEQQAGSQGGRPTKLPREVIDEAIRSAYGELQSSADEILVDEQKGRRFAQEVNRRLPGQARLPLQEIKRRLLTLRRRGPARGGLPRRR